MLRLCFILVYILLVFPSNCYCCSNANSSLDTEWNQFKLMYKKNYSKNEDCQRREVWQFNYRFIEKHNMEADKGKHTYWMGMNEHGDRTNDEIIKMYLAGFPPSYSNNSNHNISKEPLVDHLSSTPSQVDWRDRGCNISANDQQPCGSCYIFAALAVLECHHSIENAVGKIERDKISQRLSVQQIIDCANRTNYNIHGCKGGYPDEVYLLEIAQQKMNIFDGFVADSCYPYTATDHGEKCSIDLIKKCKHRVHVKKFHFEWTDKDYLKEEYVQEMIHKNGPAAVLMSVLPTTFRWYKRGVYSDSDCSSYYLNHAVALWGYGGGIRNTKEPRYWIIKNSFGSSWGDNGFAKISRTNSKNCNLETYITHAQVF